MRIGDTVEAGYERDLRPETRALRGLRPASTRYAGRHPREAIAALYPRPGATWWAASS